MKVLTIVGKVDTRALVYPIARALGLSGQTAIVTDDGAYRRLYHGEDMKGTVNGVDICVGQRVDESLIESLNENGIAYDNIIVVSTGYIPSNSTGVIACHGVDRSMMGLTPEEEEALEEKKRAEETAAKEAAATKSKKGGFGKKNVKADEEADNTAENSISLTKEEEAPAKPEVKDLIKIPEGVPSVELHISYASPTTKGMTSILLKDSFMAYVYNCEEKKELAMYTDKHFNKTLAKLLETTFGVTANEAFTLLTRSEYTKGKK